MKHAKAAAPSPAELQLAELGRRAGAASTIADFDAVQPEIEAAIEAERAKLATLEARKREAHAVFFEGGDLGELQREISETGQSIAMLAAGLEELSTRRMREVKRIETERVEADAAMARKLLPRLEEAWGQLDAALIAVGDALDVITKRGREIENLTIGAERAGRKDLRVNLLQARADVAARLPRLPRPMGVSGLADHFETRARVISDRLRVEVITPSPIERNRADPALKIVNQSGNELQVRRRLMSVEPPDQRKESA